MTGDTPGTTPPAQPEAPAIPGVTRWRKKPIVITAIQFTGGNVSEIWDAFGADGIYGPTEKNPDHLILTTIHGDPAPARSGDWVIPDGKPGTFYPCKPDVFAVTYEPASGPLVMPADEFAALKAVAEAAGEQPWTPEEIAGFRERFAAAMANPGPLRVLPSDHWKDRAESAERQLEHAKAALAGDHEGIRLWMLDCGELVAKHRTHAEAVEAKLAEVRELAGQLVTATHPTIGGTFAASIGHKFLAIIGTDEEPRDA